MINVLIKPRYIYKCIVSKFTCFCTCFCSQCAETRGARFSARTVLVVRPQREHLPALLAIQSLEEETTAEADSENGEKKLGAKKLAPRNGSKLSEETQKGGAN